MAEYLELDDIRTGGRVVYCSGLENQAGKTPETAEMADSCGLERAQDAMFVDCSAAGDGTSPGTSRAYRETPLEEWLAGLKRFPPVIRRRSRKLPFVYFIQTESGPIKIGMAKVVDRRLKHLQSCTPERLTLLRVRKGGHKQERAYHKQFAAHRLHGEWFAPHPDILAEIERLNEAR